MVRGPQEFSSTLGPSRVIGSQNRSSQKSPRSDEWRVKVIGSGLPPEWYPGSLRISQQGPRTVPARDMNSEEKHSKSVPNGQRAMPQTPGAPTAPDTPGVHTPPSPTLWRQKQGQKAEGFEISSQKSLTNNKRIYSSYIIRLRCLNHVKDVVVFFSLY